MTGKRCSRRGRPGWLRRYLFQYGLQNGLLSLSVLIVPVNPKEFFPTRPRSISNMAEYDLALRYFTVLPISVPTMVIGLISGPSGFND